MHPVYHDTEERLGLNCLLCLVRAQKVLSRLQETQRAEEEREGTAGDPQDHGVVRDVSDKTKCICHDHRARSSEKW